MAVHRIAISETVCKDVCCGRPSDVRSFVFRHAYSRHKVVNVSWLQRFVYLEHFPYLSALGLAMYGSLCLPFCTLPTYVWITWLTFLYFAYLCMDHFAYFTFPTYIWITWLNLLVYCTLPTSIWITWFTLLYSAYLCMDHFAYLIVLCLPLYGSLCLPYCTLPTSVWITLLTLLYFAYLYMDHFAYLIVFCLPLYRSLGLPYCSLPTSIWITWLTLLYSAYLWITWLTLLYVAYLCMDHFAYLTLLCLPLYESLCLPYCSCLLCLPAWLKLKQLPETSAAACFACLGLKFKQLSETLQLPTLPSCVAKVETAFRDVCIWLVMFLLCSGVLPVN